MCIIVDVHHIKSVLFAQLGGEYFPLLTALKKKRARLVYGGHLKAEYAEVATTRRFLLALDRAGAARQVPDSQVDAEAGNIRAQCESNDSHIVALARVSSARLLCTDDAALRRDFRNPQLISRPRGNIYSPAAHEHLIRARCGALRNKK